MSLLARKSVSAGAGGGPTKHQKISTALLVPAAAMPGLARESVRELRGWLMVLATVIASITCASGLSPPGGFEKLGPTPPLPRQPGDPVTRSIGEPERPANISGMVPLLYAVSPARCRVFYYGNTAAFLLPLTIILLLGSQDLRGWPGSRPSRSSSYGNVIALLVAYLAGVGSFGALQLVVCAGLVLVVPVALVAMSSRPCRKYCGMNSDRSSISLPYA